MLFSTTFAVSRGPGEDWFDPFLAVDAKVWIDPLLIYTQEFGPFVGAHEEVISFFEAAYALVAQSKGRPASAYWRRAEAMLYFPERSEFCLGYTADGIGGSGSGPDLTRNLVSGLWKAIDLGLKNLDHFEEVQIFQKGIGPDRISDAVSKILFSRFVEYTRLICETHSIPMSEFHYSQGHFNLEERRWEPVHFKAPKNPISGEPVLLCPQFFLRTLPTINAEDFWKYGREFAPDIIIAQFGDDIQSRVTKKEIIELAEANPNLVDDFVEHARNLNPTPYPFGPDPKLLIKWYFEALRWTTSTPIATNALNTFPDFVAALIDSFRHFVEENKGWRLLWNDNRTPRAEESSQNLFMGVAGHYCRANNIDVSREANIGRGAVDYKLSNGWNERALIEVKLAKNSRFWNGLKDQLPTYLRAEGIHEGVFLVICYTDADIDRIIGIDDVARQVSEQLNYDIRVEIVDARPKDSASVVG
ncbi:MAG: hypothetical protein NW200_00650 [Hyphomonadaceae bacterium]|nr:hypothetical protein [Hyphomonadaceae bacterium]